MSLKEYLNKSSTQSALALIIIIGGFIFLAFIKSSETVYASILNMMILVLGFYFGSSKGSQMKDINSTNSQE